LSCVAINGALVCLGFCLFSIACFVVVCNEINFYIADAKQTSADYTYVEPRRRAPVTPALYSDALPIMVSTGDSESQTLSLHWDNNYQPTYFEPLPDPEDWYYYYY